MSRNLASLSLLAALALGACGGSSAFQLTSDDNNPANLQAALSKRSLPATPTPLATDGHPRVFASVGGKSRQLAAYDLQTGGQAWAVDADVKSRVVVGATFVASMEGAVLVARDLQTGAIKWKQPIPDAFVGVAADRERVFVVTRTEGGTRPTYWLTAYSGSGSELWKVDAPGQLGAPAAQGGLVYTPFVRQWLSILDASSGKPLTRVRGIDEEISFVETTSDATWFGSEQGVFRLDQKAASGRRDSATYAKVTLPPQLAGARFAPDDYDAIQAGYSASDRSHILWRADARADGPLTFQDGGVAVHYFRFVLAYDLAGELRWAYSHPRVELVASAHLGTVLGGVSASGEIVALDPLTGAVRARGQFELAEGGRVLGATFDADGWAPPAGNEPVTTVASLIAIAKDRDSRFDQIKELAIAALAKLPDANVSGELLTLLDDDRASPKLKELISNMLVTRKDVSGLPALIKALDRHYDYVTRSSAGDVGLLARAIGSLADPSVEPKLDVTSRDNAIAALTVHLQDPATVESDVIDVIRALGALGGTSATESLRAHAMIYRVDDLGDNREWAGDVVSALVKVGSVEARETLRFLASDARTVPTLKEIAAAAVAAPATSAPAPAGAKPVN